MVHVAGRLVLTVLMATRNRARSLHEVLESYTHLAEPPGGWQLLLVDNGSTDFTAEVVGYFESRLPVTYVLEPRAGKGQAVNTGLDHVVGDLVLFTDDDILPPANWLKQYAEAAAAHPDFDLFGGPVRPKWPFEPPTWAVCNRRVRTVCFMETEQSCATGPTDTWFTGQNLAIRRGVLTPDQRFDTSSGPAPDSRAMCQDTELVERLRSAGHQTWWIAEAGVVHLIAPEQLTRKWMLRRAIRFGRGRYRLDEEFRRPAPQVAGMPRWVLRKALEQAGRVLAARTQGSEEDAFVAQWDLNFYRGVLLEAWLARGVGHSGGGPNSGSLRSILQ